MFDIQIIQNGTVASGEVVHAAAEQAYKVRLVNNSNERALAKIFYNNKQIDEEILPANNWNEVHFLFSAPAKGLRDKIHVEIHEEQPEIKGRFGIDFNIDIFHPYPYYPPPLPYYRQGQQELPVVRQVVRQVRFNNEPTVVEVYVEGS